MRASVLANILVIGGLVCIVAGAWVMHPSAGLLTVGTFGILAGLGVLRNDR